MHHKAFNKLKVNSASITFSPLFFTAAAAKNNEKDLVQRVRCARQVDVIERRARRRCREMWRNNRRAKWSPDERSSSWRKQKKVWLRCSSGGQEKTEWSIPVTVARIR